MVRIRHDSLGKRYTLTWKSKAVLKDGISRVAEVRPVRPVRSRLFVRLFYRIRFYIYIYIDPWMHRLSLVVFDMLLLLLLPPIGSDRMASLATPRSPPSLTVIIIIIIITHTHTHTHARTQYST